MSREKTNTSFGGLELRYPPIVNDLTIILEHIAKSTAIGLKGAVDPLNSEEMVNIAKKIEAEFKCESKIEKGLTTEDNYRWFCVIRFMTLYVEVAILIPYLAWSLKEKWHLERSVAVCGKGFLRDGPQSQGIIYETRDQIFERFKRGLLELEQRTNETQETAFVHHV